MLVIGFDESLNQTTQSCQMDFHIRYWDSIDRQVKVRYWGSKLLCPSKSLDFLMKLILLDFIKFSKYQWMDLMLITNFIKKW